MMFHSTQSDDCMWFLNFHGKQEIEKKSVFVGRTARNIFLLLAHQLDILFFFVDCFYSHSLSVTQFHCL